MKKKQINKLSKNIELLAEFNAYCIRNPEQRFWQALRNFSGATRIYYEYEDKAVDDVVAKDTFYFEKRNG